MKVNLEMKNEEKEEELPLNSFNDEEEEDRC